MAAGISNIIAGKANRGKTPGSIKFMKNKPTIEPMISLKAKRGFLVRHLMAASERMPISDMKRSTVIKNQLVRAPYPAGEKTIESTQNPLAIAHIPPAIPDIVAMSIISSLIASDSTVEEYFNTTTFTD